MKRKRSSRWDMAPDYEEISDVETDASGIDEEKIKIRKIQTEEGVASNEYDETPSEKKKKENEEDDDDDGDENTIYIKGKGNVTMEEYRVLKWQQEMAERNGPITDEELDAMFPLQGYKVLDPPPDYKPEIKKKIMGTKLEYYTIPENIPKEQFGIEPTMDEVEPSLPHLKPDDVKYFGKLMKKVDEDKLSKEEKKSREVLKLLLKIKNGNPIQRKHSLKFITNNAKVFGPKILFGHLLPLMMSPTLEEQERHYLIKVIDRIIFQLDDLVRPYAHKILGVVEPLLIDENFYARAEGKEIIANLSKAAGIYTMISVMRLDISSPDEYLRNTTARTFAVVAGALGIQQILPFVDAVCRSKSSWEARHTGIKIFQQIAFNMGCGILPFLSKMVNIIKGGLEDEETKVRVMTALSLAAMANASNPYGIEAFDPCLRNLYYGISTQKGKPLAAYLKALGAIIPLMTEELAANYTKNIMNVLVREFFSHDEEMKKTVLEVLEKCISTGALERSVIRETVVPEFFKCFWKPNTALSRRLYFNVINTTFEIAKSINTHDVIMKLLPIMKHPSEPFRRMAIETISKIISELGISDLDTRMEERLVDGCIFSFQSMKDEKRAERTLASIGTILKLLGKKCKPHLPKIGGAIKHRLINKSPIVRQQAADLVPHIAVVMKQCGEFGMLCHLGGVLYEYLGEEYPEVLGSILGALLSIAQNVGMEQMTPPIKDLLPRLTPILKNRHEKVAQNAIDLIGLIAEKGSDLVPAKEWMRISFELLECLKAQRKSIRQSAMNTFGYLALAIGPQEVISTLLSNLRVQERQLRVCTTIAIAIVGDTCAPFTILPSLMTEYKFPEMNVQNGVLKALSFLFEYIGESSKDYIYSVVPLLEDALTDRDPVHRQIACTVVKHLAINCFGKGKEDALIHLLNLVWPNILELNNVHYIRAVNDAISGLRVGLGVLPITIYCLSGLFHPSRKIRNIYWRIYNENYVYGADQMTAALPDLKGYERKYIDCVI